MNPTKLSDSILQKIKQEEITPRSKWYYRARYGSFWSLFIIMLILGALSFAVMLFALQSTDFEIFEYVETGGFMQLLTLMPFVWILMISLAIGLGVWGLKHTKRGYRLALVGIIGGNIIGSILLGSIVYGFGGGEVIEDMIETAIPQYESVREKHVQFWGNPEKTGRLAGIVESIDANNDTVTIAGPRGRNWEVSLKKLEQRNISPVIGQPIKMKGSIDDRQRFHPERAKAAPRQEKIHHKIERRFQKHPELRAKFEAKLSPETQATIKALEANGERPDAVLREQIKQEFEANTTEQERMEILPSLEPKIEIAPYHGNEDSARPNPKIKQQLR